VLYAQRPLSLRREGALCAEASQPKEGGLCAEASQPKGGDYAQRPLSLRRGLTLYICLPALFPGVHLPICLPTVYPWDQGKTDKRGNNFRENMRKEEGMMRKETSF